MPNGIQRRRPGTSGWVWILAAAGASLTTATSAQQPGAEWKAPEWVKEEANPIAANRASIERGRYIYAENCAHCHGETGKGDGPTSGQIGQMPKDISSAQWAEAQTDGELFWKISTGRLPMMPFDHLDEEDLWHAVNYVRALSDPELMAMAQIEEAPPEATLYPADADGESLGGRGTLPRGVLILGLIGSIVIGVIFSFTAAPTGPPPELEPFEEH